MKNIEFIHSTLLHLPKKEVQRLLIEMKSSNLLHRGFAFLVKNKEIPADTAIFSAIYGAKKFDSANYRKTIQRLKDALENFITHQSLKNTKKDQHLLIALDKLGQKDWLLDTSQDLLLELDTWNIARLVAQWHLSIQTTENITKKGDRNLEPKLQASSDALDDLYLYRKLKLACSALTFSSMNDHKYDLGFLKQIENYAQNKINRDKPLLYLFYLAYQTIKWRSEEAYQTAIAFLKASTIPRHTDLVSLFAIFNNFCIYQINQGQRTYLRDLHELYKLQISSENIYDDRGELDHNVYKNIVTISLHLKEFDWVKNYIETEKTKLAAQNREEHYQFAMARYLFEVQDYVSCAQLLMLSKPQDLLNNLSMRVLLCKAHFENDEWELVDSSIQNTKIFLLRHKSKAYQLQIYKNFFKLLHSIIHSKQTKTDIAKLNTLISETNPAAEKAWLIGKVKEIER